MPARAAPRRARGLRRARLDWLGATGEALYDRADAYAREYGCALVREIPGHRVSDFPRAVRHKLAHADFAPADGIWVLEIQVRDLALPVGAFYEDVLLRGPEATRADLQPDRYAQASASAALPADRRASIRQLRLDQPLQLLQRFLPAQVAHLRRDHLGMPSRR